MRIDGAAHDLAVVLPEGFSMVAELNDFGWADEGEVERVEEEQQPFRFVVVEGDFFELIGSGDPRVGFEEGGRFADHGFYCLACHKIF